LPDQSGIVTLQQLRAEPYTASTPVVFLTSSADSADTDQAEQLGASTYLFDPLALNILVAAVERSIRWASD